MESVRFVLLCAFASALCVSARNCSSGRTVSRRDAEGRSKGAEPQRFSQGPLHPATISSLPARGLSAPVEYLHIRKDEPGLPVEPEIVRSTFEIGRASENSSVLDYVVSSVVPSVNSFTYGS